MFKATVFLLLACVAGASASCVTNGKPEKPRMEVAYNKPGDGNTGIVLKMWDPAAEGRGSGCVGTMELQVAQANMLTYVYDWDVDETPCNPCFFTMTADQGATLHFKLRAYGEKSQVGRTADVRAKMLQQTEPTTLTVTAAGTPAAKPAGDSTMPGEFMAFHGKRIGSDGTFAFAKTSGGCVGSHEDAAKGVPCQTCGGRAKFSKILNDKAPGHQLGWEQKDGSDCATLAVNWLNNNRQPPLVPAPGWTSYLRAGRILTKCEGCFN